MSENEVESLRNQLAVARNEINKLRQNMKKLTHVQRKDIDGIRHLLASFRCEGCRQNEENTKNRNDSVNSEMDQNVIKFRPIGVIRTSFPEKRAVPRQSIVATRLKGIVELNCDVFTNPEHSLEGLHEFSHMWIVYYFHKNTSHPKAKVAPPRLGGERVGVFSTRSPHRPCSIGLSLVEIDKIENSSIYFNGTDMVDGTPVLDLKPYIPFYDSPPNLATGHQTAGENADFYNCRQEPDGEESEIEVGAAALSPHFNDRTTFPVAVKVPNWVVASNQLSVLFNDRAQSQLRELTVDRHSIVEVLESDPRSVYLRTKYGSQIFTFQLGEVTVTCKFDDKNSTVTVVQVRKTENVQDEDIGRCN